MKKGFTLLELIIVIIILGVLATLGLGQYGRVIERSRGAEARAVLGNIRTQTAALFLERRDLTVPAPVTAVEVGIGAAADQIPSICRPTNYFRYAFALGVGISDFTATATRCIAGGKTPDANTAGTLILTSDLAAGTDTWGGSGGY